MRQALEDLAGARESYEAGLAITERLARQDPTNTQWQQDLAFVKGRLEGLKAQQKGAAKSGATKKKGK